MMVSKQMIINDIENCGLSQWFNHKGLCSVFDDGDSYNLLISVGTSLRDENILESYSGLTLERVLELTKFDEIASLNIKQKGKHHENQNRY